MNKLPLWLGLLAVVPGHAQLLDRINDADRQVAAPSQGLTGTWMLELRPPGAPAAVPVIVTYQAEGTAIGPTSDALLSNSQGVWVRVGERKFLQTMYIFVFDENRSLAAIQKVRITLRLNASGTEAQGNFDRMRVDRQGNPIGEPTVGGTFRGVRLAAEKTAGFDNFVAEP